MSRGIAFSLFIFCVFYRWYSSHLSVQAIQVNITVDDNDISYGPSELWNWNSIPSLIPPNSHHVISSMGSQHCAPYAAWSSLCREGSETSAPHDFTDRSRAPSLVMLQSGAATAGDLTPVLTFNFTGSALYVYSTLSLSDAHHSALINLTFILDEQQAGSFTHNGAASLRDCIHGSSVFSWHDLSHSEHSLQILPALGSVFLFNYAIYTREVDADELAGVPVAKIAQTIFARSSSEDSVSDDNTPNNIAAFGGAVGGGFGVLITLGVAVSINRYRRRKRLRTQSSVDEEDGLSIHGLTPFVPRYFPNTVPPVPSPPPYDLSSELTSHQQPLPEYSPRIDTDSRSYADRAPPTPPPPPPPPPSLESEINTIPLPFSVSATTPQLSVLVALFQPTSCIPPDDTEHCQPISVTDYGRSLTPVTFGHPDLSSCSIDQVSDTFDVARPASQSQ